MSQLLKKEKITVVTGEYQKDGQTKKQRRQIGERLTFKGDDGSTYAIGKLWGPHGVTTVEFYEDDQQQEQAKQGHAKPSPMADNPRKQQPADDFDDSEIPF